MYDDADPLLSEVRRLCAALPDAIEQKAWGRPTFRAPTKIFAVYGSGKDHPNAVIFKPEADERPALLGDPRFFSPPYFGPSGWLALDLGPDVDWAEVGELVTSSYRLVAPATLVRRLDAASDPETGGGAS